MEIKLIISLYLHLRGNAGIRQVGRHTPKVTPGTTNMYLLFVKHICMIDLSIERRGRYLGNIQLIVFFQWYYYL